MGQYFDEMTGQFYLNVQLQTVNINIGRHFLLDMALHDNILLSLAKVNLRPKFFVLKGYARDYA